ncbi:hypothetical protein [Halobellus rarus]|uniref:Uncharacterized protein n=1 Tax=Halobellus rarus TaxID=1126237 RepID=A0ABD6CT31_9EURY
MDESDEAKCAARRGFEFIQIFDATVDVVHVVEQKALRLTRTNNEETQLRERGATIFTEMGNLRQSLAALLPRNCWKANPRSGSANTQTSRTQT